MKAALFFNSIASSGSIFWRTILQLMLPPLLLVVWGPARYGEWLLVTSIPMFLAITDFGFTDAATAEMTMDIAKGKKAEAQVTFQSIGLLTLTVAVVVVAVSTLLLVPDRIDFGSVVFDRELLLTTYIFVYYSILMIYSKLFLGCLKASGYYAVSTLIYDVVQFSEGACLVVLAHFNYSFVDCALAYLVLRTLNVGILIALVRFKMPWLRFGVGHASKSEIRRLLWPAMGAMAIPSAMAINFQGMAWIAAAFLGPSAAALLTTVRTASRVIIQLVGIFSRAAMPLYARSVATSDHNARRTITRINDALTIFCLIPGSIAFAVFGRQLVMLWTHGKLEPDEPLLILMAIATLFNGIWFFRSTLLLSINRHASFAATLLPLTGIFILLAIPAAKAFGLPGVAAAVAGLEFCCAISIFVLSGRFSAVAAFLRRRG
jgi:O-antigen/teichoic acid export membrane protein